MSIFLCAAVVSMLTADGGFDPGARGEEIVSIVRTRFLNPSAAAAWAEKHARYAEGSRDEADFAARTRKALAELKTSHTAYFAPDQPDYYGIRSIFTFLIKENTTIESIGVDVDPEGFARRVFAGGPGEAAGLRRGDKILEADHAPFRPVASLVGKAGNPVLLTVLRSAGGKPFSVTVTPRSINPKAEWLLDQEKSARIVERNGKKIASMRMFSGAGLEHSDMLRDALVGRFAKADALVLDLRDGWGGLSPDTVTLFSPGVPSLGTEPASGPPEGPSRYDRVWTKPLVLLINGGSKSGKEAFARVIQKRKAGTIVGEKSPGAVLAGTLIPLKGGGMLYLAVSNVYVDGERLEGVGVTPEIVVPSALPFADGLDPQWERAVDEAAR